MRIATRLVLILGITILAMMALYMVVSHQQRRSLLREALQGETEMLARTLQVVSADALRQGRREDLHRALTTVEQAEDVFAALVLDPGRQVVAGAAADADCLLRHLPPTLPAAGELSGWADCGEWIFWVAVPTSAPAAAVLVAQREVLLERAVAAALGRQLLFTLLLLAATAAALLWILHRTLTVPLNEIMRGVRSLAVSGESPRLQVPPSAGELAILAGAFNEMAEQLGENRRQRLREAEERIALERRVQEAEKFAMVGRLSGGLAHELGSPLSVISMRSEAILARRETPPEIRRQVDAIYEVVGRMTEFIQGLLHIARRQGIIFETVDLVAIVESLREEIVSPAREEEAEVAIVLPPAPVWVRGQGTLLRHALRNLVRNALHALRRKQGERTLRVAVEPHEHEVRLTVEDSGPGIPPENLERIFEPFFTTKQSSDGLGLGLPITRTIVEEHGGELSLENLPQGGVRAVISLPRSPAEAASQPRLIA